MEIGSIFDSCACDQLARFLGIQYGTINKESRDLFTVFLYSILLRGGHGGWGGGGTQVPNTVRRNGKYRNTVSKMNEIPIPHL